MILTVVATASLSILSVLPVSLAAPAAKRSNLKEREAQAWTISDKYEGQNFFDGWDFFKADDPTNGFVKYEPEDTAKSQQLAVIGGDGVVTLSVDDKSTPPEGMKVSDEKPYKRSAVRITTKKKYNGGLFVANFSMMPTGCSTWPAYWMTEGSNWPFKGELDILEGVNGKGNNKITGHTGPTCSLQVNPNDIIGTPPASMPQSCDHQPGCGVTDTTPGSFGTDFNQAGGGILVHHWDSQKIQVWHFKHDKVPQDIENRSPNPDGNKDKWGKPQFMLGGEQCDISKNFVDNSLIINTALCGDWAGGAWGSSGCNKKPDGSPLTCAEAVADPKMFSDAKWKINYIHVYQNSGSNSGSSQKDTNPSGSHTSGSAPNTAAENLASEPTPGSSPSPQPHNGTSTH